MLAVLVICALFAGFGLVLGFSAKRFKVEGDPLVEKIDALLPQTQCGQCGFPGCKPYAVAIAGGKADINQCPPGGEAGVKALAELLGVDPKPLNEVKERVAAGSVAFIDESKCIGCTLCIQACPVDAILGAPKLMHTIIAFECTGCELCIAPCPVDCINMHTPETNLSNWRWPKPEQEGVRA